MPGMSCLHLQAEKKAMQELVNNMQRQEKERKRQEAAAAQAKRKQQADAQSQSRQPGAASAGVSAAADTAVAQVAALAGAPDAAKRAAADKAEPGSASGGASSRPQTPVTAAVAAAVPRHSRATRSGLRAAAGQAQEPPDQAAAQQEQPRAPTLPAASSPPLAPQAALHRTDADDRIDLASPEGDSIKPEAAAPKELQTPAPTPEPDKASLGSQPPAAGTTDTGAVEAAAAPAPAVGSGRDPDARGDGGEAEGTVLPELEMQPSAADAAGRNPDTSLPTGLPAEGDSGQTADPSPAPGAPVAAGAENAAGDVHRVLQELETLRQQLALMQQALKEKDAVIDRLGQNLTTLLAALASGEDGDGASRQSRKFQELDASQLARLDVTPFVGKVAQKKSDGSRHEL
jgi:hypothetical protein